MLGRRNCLYEFNTFGPSLAGRGAPGGDICATAAQSINSTTFADKSFTITPTTLSPGDWLDIKIDLIYVDTATGATVDPTIAALEMLLAIRG